MTTALRRCRGHYQRLLLRHDRQVSAARSYSTRQATAAAGAPSDAAPQRSASPASRAAEASDAAHAPPSPMLDEAAQHMDVDAATSSAPIAAAHTAATADAAKTADFVVDGAAAGAKQSLVTATVTADADSPADASAADQGPEATHVEAAGSREAPIDLEAAAVQSAEGVGTLCDNVAHRSSPAAGAHPEQTVLPPPSDWGQAAGQGSGIPGL